MSIEATNVMELQAAEALLQLNFGPGPTDPATLLVSCFATPETPSTTTLQPSMNTLESTRYSVSSQEDNSEVMELHAAEALLQLHFGPGPTEPSKLLEGCFATPDTPVMELHAAEALLQLHFGPGPTDTATLLVSCFATPETPSTTTLQVTKTDGAPQGSLLNEKRSPCQPKPATKVKCEKGTQTDAELDKNVTLTDIEKMDAIISTLYANIHSLEDQLRSPVSHTGNATVVNTKPSDFKWQPNESKPSYNLIRQMSDNQNSDMVPIGEGFASVPRRVLKQIDWSSYTGATRKLLTAVFSRRVLATHSLTGKPSPAFPGKPAKKRLEPELVNDIVQIVAERCSVPQNVVRTSITTKCADESKMYRCRQQNKKKN